MIVTVLMEDTTDSPDLTPEHGLSLHLQFENRRVLFDTGGSGLFLSNAQKLGVSMEEVDTLLLSHGHRDHTGGLVPFVTLNRRAPVYLRPEAVGSHYALRPNGVMEDIGTVIPPEFIPRLCFTESVTRVDESLTLFSEVENREFPSPANNVLFEKKDGPTTSGFVHDPFRHEQNLILTTDGLGVLVTGCAHSGIINIMERFIALTGRAPDAAFGGFHLMIPSLKDKGANPTDSLDAVARRLADYPTRYFTGHCTGSFAFERLRAVLGERVQPLRTGSVIKDF